MKKLIGTIIFSLVFTTAASIASFAGGGTDTIDAGDVGTGTPVAHEHLYQTFHDDTYHWEQCIICGNTKNKASHTLHGNGGQKNHFTDYYNNAYREVCDCGYVGKPQLVILGKHTNYVNGNSSKMTYRVNGGSRLDSIKQISLSEYNSIKSSYQAAPAANYEWYDFDGDGLGFVFADALIIGNSSYGTKGSIELLISSHKEGDCGRKNAFDEYYALVMYCNSVSSPTRSGFASWLRTKIGGRTNHVLYGYDTKYSSTANVTDAQFNELARLAKGYYTGSAAYLWNSERIHYGLFEIIGSTVYDQGGCYDSSRNESCSWGSMHSTTCDLCGTTRTGYEDYDATTCVHSDITYEAGTNTTSGDGSVYATRTFTITGRANPIGTCVHEFKNVSGNIYMRVHSTGANGYTPNVTYTDWYLLPKADCSSHGVSCGTPFNITFSNGVYSRSCEQRTWWPLNDNASPTAYGYVNATTANSNWSISGNGSSDSISTHLRFTATFADADQFSYNQLNVRLFDADGTTIIKHSNGTELIPLVRIGGTPGTHGGQGLWQGVIDVTAEVNGAKNIYIQAVDSTGNVSAKMPMQIKYVDSQGPTISIATSANLNDWSTEKTLSVTATDAFDVVYLGVNNEDLKLISTETYGNKRTYKIVGNLNGEKTITFYARDGSGNVTAKSVTFSRLDNIPPVITSVTTGDVLTDGEATGWSVNTSGMDTGSGISGFALKKGDTQPSDSEYQSTGDFTAARSGKYNVWLKDKAGNVTSGEVILHSDIEYNGTEINEIYYNGKPLDCLYFGDKRLRL